MWQSVKQAVRKKVKKKVLQCLPIKRKLGQYFTTFLEFHLLPIISLCSKYVVYYTMRWCLNAAGLEITAPIGSPLQNWYYVVPYYQFLRRHFWMMEWYIDISVSVLFALDYHNGFEQWVCFVFDKPLDWVANRIQKIKPGNPEQLYKIKYYGMSGLFVYIGCVIWLLPVSNTLIYTCLIQTLIIQFCIDWGNGFLPYIPIPSICKKTLAKLRTMDVVIVKTLFKNRMVADEGDANCIQPLEEKEEGNPMKNLKQSMYTDHFETSVDPF